MVHDPNVANGISLVAGPDVPNSHNTILSYAYILIIKDLTYK